MTKRAVIYARESGDDRDTEGRNLRGQLSMGREWAERRGYQIIAELAEDDKGASGASFELPQLDRALEMARDGEFDVFIVREIDRLSRNLAKQLAVEAEFKRHKVGIEYVIGDYPDTAEGRLNKNLRASIAEFEREQINIRMTRGRKNKVKDGNVMTHGRAPYGYRLATTYKTKGDRTLKDRLFALEVYEPEARIVRLIFEWYAVERASHTEIRRRLAAMGIVTKAEAGGDALREGAKGYRKLRGACEWAASSIHHLLGNETYAGTWHYAKRTDGADALAVSVPAIVSRELWERAQTVKRGNRANMAREPKYDYLMRVQMICGHCGSKMVGTPNHSHGKTYLYYHCQARSNFARECSMGARTFSAAALDGAIWTWISDLLAHPETVEEGFATYEAARTAEQAPRRERLDVLENLLIEHRGQLTRLLDLYLAGDFPREVLTERKQRLEATVAALEKERAALADRLSGDTLTPKQKADIRRFTEQAGKGLAVADRDFKARRRLVELLDVTATLAYEDGDKVVYARCVLGENAFNVVSKSTRTPETRATSLPEGHAPAQRPRYAAASQAGRNRLW
jgi:site-specific DNA recombinase